MSNNLKNSILVIDDEENMLDMLSASLRRVGYLVVTASDGQEGLDYALARSFDFILCDLKMPKMDGLQFLDGLGKSRYESTVIMMSAYATVDIAVQAMKNGAYDFITKPFKISEILCILENGKERMRLKEDNRLLRQKVLELEKGIGFEAIIGKSKELHSALDLAKKVSSYDTTVLITGESGTGKELVARGIHLASKRSGGPFVTVNCGAIPPNLLESEFFGYTKGAFTGANSDHKGLFESASGGTILLDEIGELPLEMQVKLLRVLQERTVRPIGANISRKIDIRVLAATAKELSEEIERGAFRQDLYYRLNVMEIKLPSLRERTSDIPLLVDYFIRSGSVQMEKLIAGISQSAREVLCGYSWPGNIRELKNAIEYGIICAEDGWIKPESLPDYLCEVGVKALDRILAEIVSLKQAKAHVERYLIDKALSRTDGNKSQAAEILEISYPSLLSKIKEYGLQAEKESYKTGEIS